VSGEIVIRELSSHEDRAACVALQKDTWGRDFQDSVPASILQISQRLGGVSAGAFDGQGQLVGFVFGITGVEHGRIVHWSDMLAVRPEVRNQGVGRRLKEYQRREVARAGGEVIYWTFDPLVARNAHLNFNIFGVRAVEYVRDMYGNTGSELHRLGTDRLIVAWPVDDAELGRRRREIELGRANPALRIDVPGDIAALIRAKPAEAARRRAAVREALETALARGHRIDGFEIDGGRERGTYLLSAPTSA
jgi:predicted GNAT superfamily acetyltransferase